jgi:hypothetical protein
LVSASRAQASAQGVSIRALHAAIDAGAAIIMVRPLLYFTAVLTF